MTALVTLAARGPRRRVPRRRTTGPAPIESQIGLRPGERMTVRDLMRGAAAAQRQRRRDGARGRRVGLAQRVRARDERRGASSSACATRTSRTRSGSTRPANYSTAADLAKLARGPAAQRLLRGRRWTAGARPCDRLARAHASSTATRSSRGTRRQRREDGPHELRRLLARRLGDPRRRHGRERRPGRARARPPATRTRSTLLRYGLSSFTRQTGAARGRVLARPQARVPRRARRPRRRASVQARRAPRRSTFTVSVAGRARPSCDGPIPAGARIGTAVVRRRGRVVGRVPLAHGVGRSSHGLGRRPLQGRERPRDRSPWS